MGGGWREGAVLGVERVRQGSQRIPRHLRPTGTTWPKPHPPPFRCTLRLCRQDLTERRSHEARLGVGDLLTNSQGLEGRILRRLGKEDSPAAPPEALAPLSVTPLPVHQRGRLGTVSLRTLQGEVHITPLSPNKINCCRERSEVAQTKSLRALGLYRALRDDRDRERAERHYR